MLLAAPPTRVGKSWLTMGLRRGRGCAARHAAITSGKERIGKKKFEKRYAHTHRSLRAEICGPTRPKRTNGELTKHRSEGRTLGDDLKVPQHLGEFVLISGVVRLAFEALFWRKRLILAGLGVKLVIERL